jgi:hypothetical protein
MTFPGSAKLSSDVALFGQPSTVSHFRKGHPLYVAIPTAVNPVVAMFALVS